MSVFSKCDHRNPDCTHHWYPKEELANTITHFLGVGIWIVGFFMLLHREPSNAPQIATVSIIIYTLSLCFAYLASASYHYVKNKTLKHQLRKFDHISIYLLIAGTYTPFMLIALHNTLGWSLFTVIWACAVLGTILKLIFFGRAEWLSVFFYILMGWMGIFAFIPLEHAMGLTAFMWVLAGGVFYTVGILFYLMETIPYCHTIWHLFVLAGSLAQFVGVLLCINPY